VALELTWTSSSDCVTSQIMRFTQTKFHFVGVGGIGMCGLAELLHNMGAVVTGSDLAENANTERLKQMGIQVFQGHHENHVNGTDVVVYSSAVSKENPEIRKALSSKISLIPRAEALAEIMRLKRGIAVAGSHGKTTTTSMIASVFLSGKLEPTIAIGGRFDLIQSTARLGTGEWMVAEADESDGSFLKLAPEIAVITNIDNDHLDYHKTFARLQQAFVSFATLIPFYGFVAICGDDPLVRTLFAEFPKQIFYYGFSRENDFVLTNDGKNFLLCENGKSLGKFRPAIPGKHNALNAAAAFVAGLKVGIPFDTIRGAIEDFRGVDRRFHFRGETNGIRFYDDYGHHPTEIRATLQAFREKYPDRKITVLFQPHRYSRTETCWEQFLDAFNDCDRVFVTDVYAAGEQPLANIDSERLAREIRHADCTYAEKSSALPELLANQLSPHSLFICLGAGDVWKTGVNMLARLSELAAVSLG